MTETKRVGGKGIYVRPTQTNDMQSSRRRAVMRHAVRQSTGYITHAYIQAMTIRMNSDKNTMLKDDRENIQASESTCQINQYIPMNLYMQGDQNNHGKYRNHYAKRNKIGNKYNQHVNISNKYGNEAQRKQLSQNHLSRRINHHNQHVKYPKQIYQ